MAKKKVAAAKSPPMRHRITWAAGAIAVAGSGATIERMIEILQAGGHDVLAWDGLTNDRRVRRIIHENLRYVLRNGKMTLDNGPEVRRFQYTSVPVEGSTTGETVKCWIDYGRMLIEKTKDPISRKRVIEQIILTRAEHEAVRLRQVAKIEGWDYVLRAVEVGTVFQPVLLHIDEEEVG